MGRSSLSPAQAAAQKKVSAGRETPQGVQFAAWGPPFEFRENVAWLVRVASTFLQHYFRGLDHSGDRVADLELHLLRAPSGNHAFDRILAHADSHMSHHAIHFKLDNLPFDMVSC